MTAFPKYPAYKESGVAWLGKVPEHWEIKRNKYLFRERDLRKGKRDVTHYSLSKTEGLVPHADASDKDARAESLDAYKCFEPDDLVMNKMQAWNGIFGHGTSFGAVSPDYTVFEKAADISVRYFYYLFRTQLYIGQFLVESRGMGDAFRRLNTPQFGALSSHVPPRAEQDRIVAFLDEKTAQIDALIAKKQRQIELLDEQNAILINRAVTRGLHPNPDLQDSGIPWIGPIPKGWEVKRFRYCAHIRGGQVDPRREPYRSMTLIAPDHVESGTGQILGLQSAREQGADSGKYQVQAGDLIYSKIRPNLRKACIAPTDCLCSADMYAVVPSKALEPSFLLNYMLSEGFTKAAVDVAMRVAMPKVNRESLADFPIVIPPLAEQRKIVAHLTELENARLKAAKSLESQIQTLQTLRSTLIAHAVTGKIKV